MQSNRLTRWFESEAHAFLALSVSASRHELTHQDAEKLLVEVDEALKSDSFASRFSATIAQRFEEASKQARINLFVRLSIAGIISYNLFLPVDFVILHDTIRLAVFLQLAIATPVAVAMVIAICKFNFSIQYATLITIAVMVGCTILIVMASRSTHVVLFPAAFALFLFSGNVAQALEFKWAVVFTVLSFVCISIALLCHPSFDAAAILFHIVVLTSAAQYSLAGNYRINAGMRRAYLFALRESLRAQLLLESNSLLTTMVDVDQLTGVGNRRFFDKSLDEIWRKMDEVAVTLLMIDIDHFKKLNDTYGHQVGDTCLREVAQILASEVHEVGLCSRYGGEEFAVVLTGVDADMAFGVAERLRRRVENSTYDEAKNGLSITISIGCATRRPKELLQSSDLVHAADSALYAAKYTGRNRIYTASFEPIEVEARPVASLSPRAA